jgi:hypothetical protein
MIQDFTSLFLACLAELKHFGCFDMLVSYFVEVGLDVVKENP